MTGMEKPLVVQCRPLLCPWKDLSVALGVLGQQQQWLDAIHLLQSLGGVDQWRWIQWINGSMGTSNFEAVEHVSWEGTFALTSSVSMPALVLRCGDLPGDGRWKCFSEGSRR